MEFSKHKSLSVILVAFLVLALTFSIVFAIPNNNANAASNITHEKYFNSVGGMDVNGIGPGSTGQFYNDDDAKLYDIANHDGKTEESVVNSFIEKGSYTFFANKMNEYFGCTLKGNYGTKPERNANEMKYSNSCRETADYWLYYYAYFKVPSKFLKNTKLSVSAHTDAWDDDGDRSIYTVQAGTDLNYNHSNGSIGNPMSMGGNAKLLAEQVVGGNADYNSARVINLGNIGDCQYIKVSFFSAPCDMHWYEPSAKVQLRAKDVRLTFTKSNTTAPTISQPRLGQGKETSKDLSLVNNKAEGKEIFFDVSDDANTPYNAKVIGLDEKNKDYIKDAVLKETRNDNGKLNKVFSVDKIVKNGRYKIIAKDICSNIKELEFTVSGNDFMAPSVPSFENFKNNDINCKWYSYPPTINLLSATDNVDKFGNISSGLNKYYYALINYEDPFTVVNNELSQDEIDNVLANKIETAPKSLLNLGIKDNGKYAVYAWAVDNAGNRGDINRVLVGYDDVTPTFEYKFLHNGVEIANFDNWINNGEITIEATLTSNNVSLINYKLILEGSTDEDAIAFIKESNNNEGKATLSLTINSEEFTKFFGENRNCWDGKFKIKATSKSDLFTEKEQNIKIDPNKPNTIASDELALEDRWYVFKDRYNETDSINIQLVYDEDNFISFMNEYKFMAYTDDIKNAVELNKTIDGINVSLEIPLQLGNKNYNIYAIDQAGNIGESNVFEIKYDPTQYKYEFSTENGSLDIDNKLNDEKAFYNRGEVINVTPIADKGYKYRYFTLNDKNIVDDVLNIAVGEENIGEVNPIKVSAKFNEIITFELNAGDINLINNVITNYTYDSLLKDLELIVKNSKGEVIDTIKTEDYVLNYNDEEKLINTISIKDVGNYKFNIKLKDDNETYYSELQNFELNINKANLVITPEKNNIEKTFGEVNPELKYSYDLLEGDKEKSLDNFSLVVTGDLLENENINSLNVGIYNYNFTNLKTCSDISKNYNFVFKDEVVPTLTVNKKDITVDVKDLITTYGTSFDLNDVISIDDSQFVSYYALNNLTGNIQVLDGELPVDIKSAVGNYTIDLNDLKYEDDINNNYNLVINKNAVAKINPAIVLLTFNENINKKIFGELDRNYNNPNNFSLVGFKNKEAGSELGEFTIIREDGENVGKYPFVLNYTIGESNYQLKLNEENENNYFEIQKKTIVVNVDLENFEKDYDGIAVSAVPFVYDKTLLVNDDTLEINVPYLFNEEVLNFRNDGYGVKVNENFENNFQNYFINIVPSDEKYMINKALIDVEITKGFSKKFGEVIDENYIFEFTAKYVKNNKDIADKDKQSLYINTDAWKENCKVGNDYKFNINDCSGNFTIKQNNQKFSILKGILNFDLATNELIKSYDKVYDNQDLINDTNKSINIEITDISGEKATITFELYSKSVAVNAGSYEILGKDAQIVSNNYESINLLNSKQATISQKPITFEVTGGNKVYDNTDNIDFDLTINGVIGGDNVDGIITGKSESIDAGIVSADYTIEVTGLDKDNYLWESTVGKCQVEINKKNINIYYDGVTYFKTGNVNLEEKLEIAGVLNEEKLNIEYWVNGVKTNLNDLIAKETAYPIIVKVADSETNYTGSFELAITISDKFIVTITFGDEKLIYNKTEQHPTVNAIFNEKEFTDYTITYKVFNGSEYVEIASPVNAGKYKIIVKANESEDYVGAAEKVYDISKKGIIAPEFDVVDREYNLLNNAEFTKIGEVNGIEDGDNLIFAASGNFVQSNVGNDINANYSVTLSGESVNNYYITNDENRVAVGNIVKRGAINADNSLIVALVNTNFVYNGENVKLEYVVSNWLNNNAEEFIKSDVSIDNFNAGIYKVNFDFETKNYEVVLNNNSRRVAISARPITVNAESKSYVYDGTTNFEIKYSYDDVIEKDSAEFKEALKKLELFKIDGVQSDVGNYNIIVNDEVIVDIPNYAVTLKSNEKSITVKPLKVLVKFNVEPLTYNTDALEFNNKNVAFEMAGNETLVSDDLITKEWNKFDMSFTGYNGIKTPVGEYVGKIVYKNIEKHNFEIMSQSGSLKVIEKEIVLNVNEDANFNCVYGDVLDLKANLYLVNDEALIINGKINLVGATYNNEFVHAGNYNFALEDVTVGEPEVSNNYNVKLAETEKQFIVSKKVLNVKLGHIVDGEFENLNKEYLDNDPELCNDNIVIDGIVAGDESIEFEFGFGNIVRDAGETVGDYIYNGEVSFLNGDYEAKLADDPKLTINPRKIVINDANYLSKQFDNTNIAKLNLTINNKSYDGSEFVFNGKNSGIKFVYEAQFKDIYCGENVGTELVNYSIKLVNDNKDAELLNQFELVGIELLENIKNGTANITKADLNIDVENLLKNVSKIYDGNNIYKENININDLVKKLANNKELDFDAFDVVFNATFDTKDSGENKTLNYTIQINNKTEIENVINNFNVNVKNELGENLNVENLENNSYSNLITTAVIEKVKIAINYDEFAIVKTYDNKSTIDSSNYKIKLGYKNAKDEFVDGLAVADENVILDFENQSTFVDAGVYDFLTIVLLKNVEGDKTNLTNYTLDISNSEIIDDTTIKTYLGGKINKKKVSVSCDGSVSASTKFYDGTTSAEIDNPDAFNFEGILEEHKGRLNIKFNIEFVDKNVGENKDLECVLDDAGLTDDSDGEIAKNYVFETSEIDVKGNILPRKLYVDNHNIVIKNKIYNGVNDRAVDVDINVMPLTVTTGILDDDKDLIKVDSQFMLKENFELGLNNIYLSSLTLSSTDNAAHMNYEIIYENTFDENNMLIVGENEDITIKQAKCKVSPFVITREMLKFKNGSKIYDGSNDLSSSLVIILNDEAKVDYDFLSKEFDKLVIDTSYSQNGFADKNVGTEKDFTVRLTGDVNVNKEFDAKFYTVDEDLMNNLVLNGKANIEQKNIDINLNVIDKVYDGLDFAKLNDNFNFVYKAIGNDELGIKFETANYYQNNEITANAGNSVLKVNGITIDNPNYKLTVNNLAKNVNVAKAKVNINVNDLEMAYYDEYPVDSKISIESINGILDCDVNLKDMILNSAKEQYDNFDKSIVNDIGTYAVLNVKFDKLNLVNYDVQINKGTLKINMRNLHIKLDEKKFINKVMTVSYGEKIEKLEKYLGIEGLNDKAIENGEEQRILLNSLFENIPNVENVGKYALKLNLSSDVKNYNIDIDDFNGKSGENYYISIVPKILDLELDENKLYSFTFDSRDLAERLISEIEGADCNNVNIKFTVDKELINAKDYDVTITCTYMDGEKADPNYSIKEFKDVKVKINKKVIDFNLHDKTASYNGKPIIVEPECNLDDFKFIKCVYDGKENAIDVKYNKDKDVDSYIVSVVLNDNTGNYELAESEKTCELQILPIEVEVEIGNNVFEVGSKDEIANKMKNNIKIKDGFGIRVFLLNQNTINTMEVNAFEYKIFIQTEDKDVDNKEDNKDKDNKWVDNKNYRASISKSVLYTAVKNVKDNIKNSNVEVSVVDSGTFLDNEYNNHFAGLVYFKADNNNLAKFNTENFRAMNKNIGNVDSAYNVNFRANKKDKNSDIIDLKQKIKIKMKISNEDANKKFYILNNKDQLVAIDYKITTENGAKYINFATDELGWVVASNAGTNWAIVGMYIGIGAGVLLIIIIVTIVAIKKKKKNKTA